MTDLEILNLIENKKAWAEHFLNRPHARYNAKSMERFLEDVRNSAFVDLCDELVQEISDRIEQELNEMEKINNKKFIKNS